MAIRAALLLLVTVLHAVDAPLTGSGAWTYRFVPDWGAEPATPGPLHGGLAVMGDGHVIASSEGENGLLEYTADGALVRAYAPQWKGLHHLLVRKEGDEEFLYASHLAGHQVAKLHRDGTAVWTLGVPPVPELYAKPESFKPTCTALAADGRLFVADGYGRSVIHRYDAGRHHLGYFGQQEGPGKLNTPHAILVVQHGSEEVLLVADRAHRRLVGYSLTGEFLGEWAKDLRLPAAFAVCGDHLVVAELQGRVAIVDRDYHLVASLGENLDGTQSGKYDVPRERWRTGIFNAPHAVAVDARGDIYVLEWNRIGRLHKLVHVQP